MRNEGEVVRYCMYVGLHTSVVPSVVYTHIANSILVTVLVYFLDLSPSKIKELLVYEVTVELRLLFEIK